MDREKESFILIIDDNPANLQLLGHILRENKYKTAIAKDGMKALALVDKKPPDLILLDAMIPEIGGFEVCQMLKASDKTKEIPVIFISPLADTSDRIKCFDAGGADYIAKPFQQEEILAKVRVFLELRHTQEKLKSAYQTLESATKTDSLTTLPNHRDIIDKIEYERIRYQRNRKEFSLVLAKIDDFKMFNDRFGHGCSDFVLLSVARIMRARLRKQDIVARWGNDEFLLLLPETDLKGGKVVAEAMRQKLSDNHFEYGNHKLEISMTFAVSPVPQSEDINEYVKMGYYALDKGKEVGKNCILLP